MTTKAHKARPYKLPPIFVNIREIDIEDESPAQQKAWKEFLKPYMDRLRKEVATESEKESQGLKV